MSDKAAPILVLRARAEARALLYVTMEYNALDAAVQPLWDYAAESGLATEIGADRVYEIIRKAFEDVGEEL